MTHSLEPVTHPTLHVYETLHCREVMPGVHEFTLHCNNRQTAVEAFDHLEMLYAEARPDQALCLLFDIREAGAPPIGDVWQLARKLFEHNPHRPRSYTAILHSLDDIKQKTLVVALGVLAQLFHGKLGFFSADEHGKAINWLMTEAARAHTGTETSV